MDIFNGNQRLENNILYSLEWAKYIRHSIGEPVFPFLFEWKEDEIFMNMLEPGDGIDEFAFKIAKESKNNSDQFVIGVEGIFNNEDGTKTDVFLIKGFDKTQNKGVFIIQKYKGIGKEFKLLDKPIFVSNPDLPFPVDNKITGNYKPIDLHINVINLKNEISVVIFSDSNPVVLSRGIKNYIHSKTSENSSEFIGKIEFSIAPFEGNKDFLKYCLLETIYNVKSSSFVKDWELNTGKELKINLKYNKVSWHTEFSKDIESSNSNKKKVSYKSNNKDTENSKHKQLVIKYSVLLKDALDKEFLRIVSIPESDSNIKCIAELKALNEVYEKRNLKKPIINKNIESNKKGCLSVVIIIITIIGFVVSIM